MRVVFRVDASHQIGTGHVVRCLTLAKGLRMRNVECFFLTKEHKGHLLDLIKKSGFTILLLSNSVNDYHPTKKDPEHASWLGGDWKKDSDQARLLLADISVDLLIVDHYSIDFRWEKSLRNVAKRIMVIDDLSDRVHDCDILLDQNYYKNHKNRYFEKIPHQCITMLGPKYALLDEKFKSVHKKVKVRKGRVKRIFVFFGGVDKDKYTLRFVRILQEFRFLNIHVDCIIGSQNPSKDKIVLECIRYGFDYHIQTNKISEIMSKSDLAICAGGVITWERICCLLPAIVITTANNQIEPLKEIKDLGLIYYLGHKWVNVNKVIRDEVYQAILDVSSSKNIILNKALDVDGLGVERVVSRIIKSE